MRRARVFNHGRPAGLLEELDDGTYRFTYRPEYVVDETTDPVSLTLPKREAPFESETLFAFFVGLLSEGSTRKIQARTRRIDQDDEFGLLLATGADTIGSVTVEPVESEEES
jgi:serine/threonine-protein kinase HipA